jgi:hypothetical protein
MEHILFSIFVYNLCPLTERLIVNTEAIEHYRFIKDPASDYVPLNRNFIPYSGFISMNSSARTRFAAHAAIDRQVDASDPCGLV